MSTAQAVAKSFARSGRWPEATRDVRAVLLGVLVVTPVASANGGYFPTSWGWPALGLAWLAGLAVLLRPAIRASALELVCGSALAGLALWTGLSALWSPNVGQTGLALERTLVYVAGLAAALLVVRSGSYRALLTGVAMSTTLVTSYAALTRTYPDRFHFTHTVAGNRLAEPLGYWNALGMLAALGALILLGFVAHGHSARVRAGAAVALFPHLLALYFTFSRGAWIALALGLAVAVVFDPRRFRVVLALLATAPLLALAVLYASRQNALTQVATLGPNAGVQGRHVAFAALALAVAAAFAVAGVAAVERFVGVPVSVERSFPWVLGAAALAALLAVFVLAGSPQSLVRRGWHSFNAPPIAVQNDLNARLFSLSGTWRTDLWKVALKDARDHPLVGSGAGTYREEWQRRRAVNVDVVNAHNVYLETLAELGPVGLGLLLVALGAPLVAAFRARGRTLVPVAAAAYAAFLVHAAVDWDWQVPGLTLAALFTGAAILGASRRDGQIRALGRRARGGLILALLAVALVSAYGMVPNRALTAAAHATLGQRPAVAEQEARKAHRWAPWDARPLQLLGEAQLQVGDLAAARTTFRQAIAKDRGNYELWLDLALASTGTARRDAARVALRLNPLAPETTYLRPALGLGTKVAR